VPKNESRAAELYEQACTGGNTRGCINLSFLYADGLGVPKDESRAATLFEQACKGGDTMGCNNLGAFYGDGRGVPKDERRAVTLYEQACKGGNTLGCNNLGLRYEQGRGVPKDERRAATLFEQACKGGHAKGCYNLGLLYKNGRGVPKDARRAATLLEQACESGESAACPRQPGTPVLGFEVGVSTLEQVKATLSKKTQVKDNGINKWSKGPMLKTNGSSYEIEGLNSVLYIFDEQKTLMGVVMDMNKKRFDSIYEVLSKKYKMKEQKRPFVGDQFALFESPGCIIELDAPHLGFQMEVRYLRSDLVRRVNSQSEAEDKAKKKREADQF
jgi:hypothetical protein